jgi:hypothetical protein
MAPVDFIAANTLLNNIINSLGGGHQGFGMATDGALRMAYDESPTIRATVRAMNDIVAARAVVAPYVGDLPPMAFDSVDSVYLAVLQRLGHDTREIARNPGSAKAMWPTLKNTRPRQTLAKIAMDRQSVANETRRFPGTLSLKQQ